MFKKGPFIKMKRLLHEKILLLSDLKTIFNSTNQKELAQKYWPFVMAILSGDYYNINL